MLHSEKKKENRQQKAGFNDKADIQSSEGGYVRSNRRTVTYKIFLLTMFSLQEGHSA